MPALNDPDNLKPILIFLTVPVFLALLWWGFKLERRSLDPYTLAAMPSAEQWRKSLYLGVIKALPVPVFFLLISVTAPPDVNVWLIAPLFGTISLAVLIFNIILTRIEFYRAHQRHVSMDKGVKDGTYARMFRSPFFKWTEIFMSQEDKRFMKVGFPDTPVSPQPDQPKPPTTGQPESER